MITSPSRGRTKAVTDGLNEIELALTDGLVMDEELFFELRGDRPNPYEMTEDDIPLTEEEFFELSREWAARVVDFDLQPIEH